MNLRDRLIEQLNHEIETRQESILKFLNVIETLRGLDGLDIEVKSTGSIWASDKTIHINCYTLV